MILDGYEICSISEDIRFIEALSETLIAKKLQHLENAGRLTGFWVIDFENKKIFWSKELIQIYEYLPKMFNTESNWINSFDRTFQAVLKGKLNQFLSTSDPLIFAGLLNTQSKTPKWLLMLGYNLKNSYSHLPHAIGFVCDVTP